MKRLRHTESNMRGPLAYADVPAQDKTLTFGAHTSSAGPTPENQEPIVPNTPRYENSDSQNIESNAVNFYSDPDYESDDSKITEINKDTGTFRAEPEYATVDKRKDIDDVNSYPEIGYENPDYIKKEGDVGDSHPVDNSYAVVNKKKKKEKPVPSEYDYATVDIKQNESDEANSYPETGYENLDFKMKEVDGRRSKKKKKEKSVPSEYDYATVDIKQKESDEANSYPEIGYETPDFNKKAVDGKKSKKKKKEKSVPLDYDRATVDIKQKERKSHPVDNSYATVDKKKKKEKPAPSECDYATVDIKQKKADKANSNPKLGYEKLDVKKTDVDSGNSYLDTTYESIDETNERDRQSKKINATTTRRNFGNDNGNEARSDDIYSTPYSDVPDPQDDLDQSSPEIKHIQVNGDTYALPNKK